MRARRWQAEGPGGLTDLAFVDVDLPQPGPGEVLIGVRLAGVNPADLKHAVRAAAYPWPLGYEIAGEIIAIGPDTVIASGGGRVGDPVLAFRVRGGFATALLVPARDVFARPDTLSPTAAATLLLAATTAAEMLHVVRATADDVVLVHGASGSVGLAAIQLGARRGARMIGVCGEHGVAAVRAAGGEPIVRSAGWDTALASLGVTAVLDAAGSDASIDASLALVADRDRIVTIAAPARAASDGFPAIAGNRPESAAFRDGVRAELIALAASGALRLPASREFPLSEAPEALALVSTRPSGKITLRP